jgi:hypothetical protein
MYKVPTLHDLHAFLAPTCRQHQTSMGTPHRSVMHVMRCGATDHMHQGRCQDGPTFTSCIAVTKGYIPPRSRGLLVPRHVRVIGSPCILSLASARLSFEPSHIRSRISGAACLCRPHA